MKEPIKQAGITVIIAVVLIALLLWLLPFIPALPAFVLPLCVVVIVACALFKILSDLKWI